MATIKAFSRWDVPTDFSGGRLSQIFSVSPGGNDRGPGSATVHNGGTSFTFGGIDLGSSLSSGIPTSGTITFLRVRVGPSTALHIGGLSLSASLVAADIQNHAKNALNALFFNGDDRFVAEARIVQFEGFGGDDKFFDDGMPRGAVYSGGDGDDRFLFNFGYHDCRVDGGNGQDAMYISGGSADLLSFSRVSRVEKINLSAGDYRIDVKADAQRGHTLVIDGSKLDSTQTLTATSNHILGHLKLIGGAGDDNLKGHNGDKLIGSAGSDQLKAVGHFHVTFSYGAASDSTGSAYDVIDNFNPKFDKIEVSASHPVTRVDPMIVAHVDPQAIGQNYTGDISGVPELSALGPQAAAIVKVVDQGDPHHVLDWYLVIDQNGTAGYQSGSDLVVRLEGASDVAALSTANFTTHG